eukprot:Hpha_TRINITY_DN23230_c0_g1::TRINITY_DN23230_c0_g1_i1::g.30138::m.30138
MGQTWRRQCGCGEARWKGKPPSQIFASEEDEPTRTCLPQVDPLHKERVEAQRATQDGYNAAAMKRRGPKAEETSLKPLPSGWPVDLPSPLPPQEFFGEYWVDRFNWEARLRDLLAKRMGPGVQELLGDGAGGNDRWESFAELEDFFFREGFPRPKVYERDWRSDAEFVRARLEGPHPSVLSQVGTTSRPLAEKLPVGLQLDDVKEAVKGKLGDCRDLEEAAMQGRLFMVDHSYLLRELVSYGERGWEWEYARGLDRKQASLCNPVALFFRTLALEEHTVTVASGQALGVKVEGGKIVELSGPAEKCGLRVGLKIHRIGSVFVRDDRAIDEALRAAAAKGEVRFEVYEGQGSVTPLCIQLYVAPSHPGHAALVPRNPIYTPSDPPLAWLAAKIAFNQADMHVHLVGALHTQTVMIPALLASVTCRNLSPHHPLRQLLRPHLRGCIGWAERWDTTLVGDDDTGLLLKWLGLDRERYQDLSTRSFQKYDFINSSIKHDWRQRVSAPEDLPGYTYREDATALWEVVEQYVSSVVRRYYTRPDDIERDDELVAWIREMSSTVNRVMELHPARPWDPIVFNLTNVITLCSARYAAHAAPVFDWYGCVPFFPAHAGAPVPVDKRKEDITEHDLLRMLPSKQASVLQVGCSFLLSESNCPEASSGMPRGGGLGSFNRTDIFVDRAANRLVQPFRDHLAQLESRMQERNTASSSDAYAALLPSHVRNGISAVS